MANRKAVNLMLDHMHKATKTKSKGLKGATNHEPDERVAKFSLSYLDAFGYLGKELAEWKNITIGDIVEAVKKFQGMFGLKKNGEVTVQTIRAMEMPRCGCPDFPQDHNNVKAIKDFVAANLARWQKTSITYAITAYVSGVSKTDFETIIYEAFQTWCQHGNFNAQPTKTNQADIVISTGRGGQSNFDGAGGTLAWAYLPNGSDGQLQLKFDLDETWITNPAARGILLANVASHEIGHCAGGLDHSRVNTALMAPYYNAAIAVPQTNDDIPRFVARYGARTNPTTPVTPSSPASIAIVSNNPVNVSLNGRALN